MSIWPRHLGHVVLVTPRHPEMSGGSTFVRTMQEALEADGVAVDVVSVWPGTTGGRRASLTVYPDEQLHRGPVLRGQGGLAGRARGLPRLVRKRVQRTRQHRRLRQLLGSLGPGSVVIFTHPLGRIAAEDAGWRRPANGPVLVGQHHSQFRSLEDETWLAEAIPRYFSDVDAFVALTDDDAEQFARILPVPCFGIGNPVAPPPAPTPGSVESPTPAAVALARFSHEKQLDVMIRCFVEATSPAHLRHWRLRLLRGARLSTTPSTLALTCSSESSAVSTWSSVTRLLPEIRMTPSVSAPRTAASVTGSSGGASMMM